MLCDDDDDDDDDVNHPIRYVSEILMEKGSKTILRSLERKLTPRTETRKNTKIS